MGCSNLRSLLIAAIVISNCITWTASRHHYTHNVSGHRSRHRRQGAGLYLPASYVIPGGDGQGAWGEWGETSPCSRTCGGGVASQKRICLEIGPDGRGLCSGGDTKYFSCQTQDCPDGSPDYRAQQCSEADTKPFRGINYQWVPYTNAPNPCELNCMPRGERFYFRQQQKVVDGTRCNNETYDVCVDGTCQPVGCDMMLGSNAREDKCRVCRGNGTDCHTVSGLIDTQDLRQGYNDILLIPQGATTIVIAEIKNSNNYLALRGKRDKSYYLNGDYKINFPRSMMIAGALWYYEREQQGFAAPDKLRCAGPTTEPLYLSLLLQDVNVGVEYEYSVPSSLAPPPYQQYNWVHDDFTPCSATCGGGSQTRNVTCRSREELEVVDETLCDEGLKPPTEQACGTQPCAARWVTGEWEPCSKPCGQGGTRSRQVRCEKVFSNGRPSIVADKECFDLLGPKPELYQECNKNESCPTWFTGPWKPCDKLCGEGKQTRQVVCHERVDGRVHVLPEEHCIDERPPAEQSCMLHPCVGVDWVLSEWTGCDSCLSTVRSRQAVCATKERQVVDASLCSYHAAPVQEEPCDKTKLPACEVQWYATQWSNCSSQCGKGVQTRRIFCGLFDGASVLKVDDSRCDNETKYNDTKPCEIPKEKCPAKWFAGPWSECTKECGGGEQFRRVMCLMGGKEASGCDEESVLDSTQSCNAGPCDQDEMLPVDSRSTPIMDDQDEDYEDCVEDEDYAEVGAEEDEETETSTDSVTFEELMSSDMPSTPEEGSGSTTWSEIESEFTSETGSGSEPTMTTETLETEASGTGSTEIEETSETSATEATESTESESTVSGLSEGSESDVTEETGSTVTEEIGSTVTEETEVTNTEGSTETSITDTSASSEQAITEESTIGSSEGISEASASESDMTTEGSTDATTDVSETETVTTEISSTSDVTDSSSEASTIDASTTEASSESSEITEDIASTTEAGTTEIESSGSTEAVTDVSGTEETGSTVTEESGATETGVTDATDTSEETTDSTDVSGATEVTDTGSTEVTEEEVTESGATEITLSTESEETEMTDATETTESGATEATESTVTEETESTFSTEESSSMSDGSTTEESTISEGTTPWDWTSTVDIFTKKPKCKPRKKPAKCIKSKFGCCPDKKTPAAGPFDEGCPNPKTCKESKHGCCSDGVSPAAGPKDKGCPITPCNETLFGCCKSDKKTPAEGNDQEGCPPPPPACKASKFGCCKDEKTAAKGPKRKGCPETTPASKKTGCADGKFGCCYDNKTAATGPDGQGCPCDVTEFGCCPDDVSPAGSAQMEGCVMSCNTSAYGCCPDGQTPAHGPGNEGCCLLYSFGCCPDNYNPAKGPNYEGCACEYAPYGCCPDNVTVARGHGNLGCGCRYAEHGCCPDRHTDASGPNYEGCGCHTYQFGCCPDGETIAKGPNLQGCHCRQSKYGCCGDDQTAAKGPDGAGCDCSASKYGCCPDGQTEASGEKFLGCSDIPENRQAACSLSTDRGPCRNYTVYWYYDLEYGGCSRFWYGGCDGNSNKFASREECQDVCVNPAPKDACKLPQVKGACQGYHLRWYYDNARQQCGQFVFGGCLGNANNFESRELCQEQCQPDRGDDQCKLPIERGSCAGNFSRWGFNAEAGRCEQFMWGGCEGNNNRFGSEAACIQRCDPPGALKPQCSEDQNAGNCSETLAKWSFSGKENRCVPFYYSGCGGNGNQFDSERSCTEACPGAHVDDLCTLPALTGECGNYRERWYYNTADQACRQFYYGGCGGNANNFASQQECEGRCSNAVVTTTTVQPAAPGPFTSDFCFLEKDPGPCSGAETRWAYDSALGRCEPFRYGGCAGNRNNFASQEYCQYYCVPTQDICQLPMRSGPCEESLMRWFYDPVSDSCSQFTYGGCDGNDNRFESLEDCERRCRTGPPQTTPTAVATTPLIVDLPPDCRIPTTLEICRSSGEVWYYDPARQECVSHSNEGQGASCRHSGTFNSQEACLRSCGIFRNLEVCRYPLDAGPCREPTSKYFFNVTAGECERFTYSGCHGGPNRFSSAEECQQVCIPHTDPCKQAPDGGNCLGYFIKWYFDESVDSCREFVYGGCHGNDNRFDTREECEGQCRVQATTTTTVAPLCTPEQLVSEECRTPESLAPCGDNVTMWYYDTSSRRCEVGEMGGCRHPNSYRTEEECLRNCGAFKGQDVCGSHLDPGPCRASIPKVFFDPTTGECKPYAYGGCAGGPNRFSSVDECEEVCGATAPAPQCRVPVSTGQWGCGSPAGKRWYYSPQHGDCLGFVYNGCGGNDNNFPSYEDCANLCKPFVPDPNSNEIVPDCSSYATECASLRCQYSVQRTRTAAGCERCSCVQLETDCAPFVDDCRQLKCHYGLEKRTGEDGCERCSCLDHPCASKSCPSGENCVVSAYRDPDTQEPRYTASCRVANKPGSCPNELAPTAESECRRECNSDADCAGAGKCCPRGCSQLCRDPAAAATSAPSTAAPTHPTYVPELPQAPQANEETEPEVTSQEGGKATLRCLFHSNPPPKITWRRGEITIDGNVGRYRLLSDGALEIVSLYRNDSGVYICVADNGLGTARQEIRLLVNDPVVGGAGISGEAGTAVTGELGRPLYVRCLAYGHPPPQLAWYRGPTGPMVPFSSNLYEARENVLQIRSLDLNTLGEYTCQAYNGYGKPTSWTVVVQAYRPEGRWSDNQYLVSRDRIVVVTPRDGHVTDTTTTTTIADNEVPVYRVPVNTRIVADQTTLSVGSELSLPCEVDGYPLPEVYWTKDGNHLSPSDRMKITDARLTISQLTSGDSGLYGCHATNEFSSHSSTVQINVQGLYIPTTCTDSPYFANCQLIVRSKFCHHHYYSKFCCKSCVQSGQLNPDQIQSDMSYRRK